MSRGRIGVFSDGVADIRVSAPGVDVTTADLLGLHFSAIFQPLLVYQQITQTIAAGTVSASVTVSLNKTFSTAPRVGVLVSSAINPTGCLRTPGRYAPVSTDIFDGTIAGSWTIEEQITVGPSSITISITRARTGSLAPAAFYDRFDLYCGSPVTFYATIYDE